jgi:hypothetical protein
LQRQLSLEPMDLRFVQTLAIFVYHGERFGQYVQPLFGLPYFPIRLGQQSQKSRRLCPKIPGKRRE